MAARTESVTGWRWCPGARDHCAECRRFVTGLWKHFVSTTTSNVSVCAACAGCETIEERRA